MPARFICVSKRIQTLQDTVCLVVARLFLSPKKSGQLDLFWGALRMEELSIYHSHIHGGSKKRCAFVVKSHLCYS